MKPVRILLAALLVTAASPAMAQMNLFPGKGPKLSAPDYDMLLSSIDTLNRTPDVAVGARQDWHNPSTASFGTTSVVRVFTDSGMNCHRLHLDVAARGRKPPFPYDLTMCLMSDGAWKVKN